MNKLVGLVATALVIALTVAGVMSTHGPKPLPESMAAAPATSTAPTAASAPASIIADFTKDLAELTKAPHRLAGTDEALAAGKYVQGRLKQIGIEQVFVQDFPVAVFRTRQCAARIDGQDARMYAMRPDVLQGVVTPPEGITGQTVYAGLGELRDYPAAANGKIVVLDFAASERWPDAFAMGAQAIIFIGSHEAVANPCQHVNFPANLPRFYVTPEVAEQFKLKAGSHAVTLNAVCAWEMRQGRNVFGYIPGTDPRFSLDRDEAILLTAPLDSLSEVPQLSPGARSAGNCAALLMLADYLQKNRPKRGVIIGFLDGDAADHAGARAFFGGLYRVKDKGRFKLADTTLADRLKNFEDEKTYLQSMLTVLDKGDIFSAEAKALPNWENTVIAMRAEARGLTGGIREKLQLIRMEMGKCDSELTKLARSGGNDDAHAKRVAELEAKRAKLKEQADPLDAEDRSWSDLERALNDRVYPASTVAADKYSKLTPEALQKAITKYGLLVEEMKRLNHQRQQEAAAQIEYIHQTQAMADVFGDDKAIIVLHLVMNMGDASKRWAFIQGSDSTTPHKNDDNPGNYGQVFKALRNLSESPSFAGRLTLFENRTITELFTIRAFAPGLFASAGSVAGTFGVENLSLMTPMDRRPRDGQPVDVVGLSEPGPARPVLNVGNMIAPLAEIAPFVKGLGDATDMSISSSITPCAFYTDSNTAAGKSDGASAQFSTGSSATSNQPARGALVAVLRKGAKIWDGARVDLTPPGFQPFSIVAVNTSGRFEPPPLSKNYYTGPTALLLGAMFDPAGMIVGITNKRTVLCENQPLTKGAPILFRCDNTAVTGLGFDRGVTVTQVLKASSTALVNEDQSLVVESGNAVSVYAWRGIEKVKLFNADGLVVLNNQPSDPVGVGLLVQPFAHWDSTPLTAIDLYVLNDSRLQLLKNNGILAESLEQIQVDAQEIKEKAAAAPDSGDRKISLQAASAAMSRRVYKPLLEVLNDLVVAVVMLLLLTIPFAYAIERLLIGTPHIYRQIGWFAVFFVVTFAVLYMVNPAFRIASTPIIIFLAFTIILLSMLVIVIMTRKLQSEVRRMQGLGSTVHSSDVSRLGTMMAAVSMGISTMRRRPIRTLLTAVTVVLLTFTILTFASFTSSYGTRRTEIGPLNGPERILVRHPFWSRLPDSEVATLAGFLQDQATVVPRYWVSQTAGEMNDLKTAQQKFEYLLATSDGAQVQAISAMVGLDMRDLEHMPGLKEMFVGDLASLASDGIFLTAPVADHLGLKTGDTVFLAGEKCRLGGIIDLRKLTNYRLVEGSSVLPVNYEASSTASVQQESKSMDELPEVESSQFITFTSDKVAFIPAGLSRKLGGRVASANIYPGAGADLEKIGRQVATVTHLPTYVGAKGGTIRLFFTSLTEASGWKDLVIPVILGGLIIFATMLGSVSDREKEIYAFSALGLAPPHVASLFFAEAGVYAVVGGMGGYLLGQVVARGLSWVSETFGILSVPPMNYSSTNAIVTVMVVMATVLISTIYPAIKASHSANPGIQRAWRIGKPEGDLYDIVFPFTVSTYDITGVVSFLKEHFENYSDTSLGCFATSHVHIFRQADELLGMQAEVALAPFDLGVSQKFALLAKPSEIPGIDEIRILLLRLAGTGGDWQRANRVFISELRKQLLIWRSLTPEVMERYRLKTLGMWKELPVETVTPATLGGTA